MWRTNGGGSILKFSFVAAGLTLVLFGGIWMVRSAIDQPAHSQPVAVNPSTQTNKTPSAAQAPRKSSSDDSHQKSQAAAPSKTSSPAPAPTTSSSSAPSSTASSNLPETGPADWVGMMLGSGFLTAATMAYVRSRRLPLRSL